MEMVRRYRLAQEVTETTGRPNPLEIPEKFKGMYNMAYKRLIERCYGDDKAAARVATVAAYEFCHKTPHLYCDYELGQPGCPHDTTKPFDPLQTPPPKPAKTQNEPSPSKPAETNNDSPPSNPTQEQNPAPNNDPPDDDHPEEYPPDDPPEPEPESEPRRVPLRNLIVERYPLGGIDHNLDHDDPGPTDNTWPDTTEHDPGDTYDPPNPHDVITRVTGPPAPSAEPEPGDAHDEPQPFKPYEILPGIRVTSPPVPIEYDDLDDPIPKTPR